MYVLAWTPNFCGEAFQLEEFDDHESMATRLKEIHDAKYEDVSWNLYTSLSEECHPNLKLIEQYHNEMSMMNIWIDPSWYGGRNYRDENIRDARLGKILMKYIDRLNDPIEEKDSGHNYCDPLQDIVKEMSDDVTKEIELQRE